MQLQMEFLHTLRQNEENRANEALKETQTTKEIIEEEMKHTSLMEEVFLTNRNSQF